jgi:hypothetical protein
VELNAFTSPQFIEWLESKLTEHKIEKVIRDTATLKQAYRRAAGISKLRQMMRNAQKEVISYADSVEIPADLTERLKEQLAENPSISWDDAIEWLLV